MKNLGLFYLLASYQSATRKPDIASSPGLTNQNIQGYLLREGWSSLEPNADGKYDWSYLDGCVAACEAHGKLFSFQHLAGYVAPPAFFNLPGAKYLNLANVGKTVVPWDPVFQAKWEALHTAMATKYKSHANLAYVVLSGIGRASESFLTNATDPQDEAAADALAKAMGYADLSAAWIAGAKWNIDMMSRVWAPKPIVLTSGTPFVNGGVAAQNTVFNYGHATYPTQFGIRRNDLTAGMPPDNTYINITSGTCAATGYQFGSAQNLSDPAPPARLKTALLKGISFGAHFLELFTDDADDPRSVPALKSALTAWGMSST